MTDTPPAPTIVIQPVRWTERLCLSACYPQNAPLEVDVGCGKGRFLLARAAAHPERNFLGIERQLARIRKVDRRALRQGLTNVRLLHVEAAYALEWLLPDASVEVCYVFCPDPWPKRRHHGRRLFGPAFLDTLWTRLTPGGCLHVRTDHADYFTAIAKTFAADPRFEPAPPFEPAEAEITDFELIFRQQGLTMHRGSFRRRADAGAAAPLPPPP